MSVEGHLRYGGGATNCACRRSCRPPFPVGSSRLVEVDMNVDDSREDMQSACIDLLAPGTHDIRRNLGDPAITYRDVAADDTAGGHDFAAAHQEVERGHWWRSSGSALMKRSRTSIATATSLVATDSAG